MEATLEDLAGRKRRLLGLLERLAALLTEAGNGKAAERARALKESLSLDRFQVVVMGEFKRGKSTLINALIGKPLLPMASVPLTSVVTVVRHSTHPKADVEFLGGRRGNVPVDSIQEYISEESNPKNVKGVERVVVGVDAPLVRDGALLVDTPGVGSIYRHNTEVARAYLPNADAVILVLSADPPIGQAETEFLRSMRRLAGRLFVVLNKVDYLAGPDLARARAFTEKVVRETLDDPAAVVFPISAKRALEAAGGGDGAAWKNSGFAELAPALERLLIRDKGEALLEAARSRALELTDGLLAELALELKACASAAGDVEARAAGLRRLLEAARRKESDLGHLHEAALRGHLRDVEERLYGFVRARTGKIVEELEALYASVKDRSGEAVRAELNRAFMDRIESAFTSLVEQEQPKWSRSFQQAAEEYLAGASELVNQAQAAAAGTLGTPFKPLPKPALAIAPPSVWFSIEETSVWSAGFQSVPTLRLFKPFFWRALKRRVFESMDVNAGRVRYDYARRMEKAGEAVREAVEGYFEDSSGALRRALAHLEARRGAASEASRATSAGLEKRRAAAEALRRELSEG